MRTNFGPILLAGLSSFAVLAASHGPALGKCLKYHPLLGVFGVDVYVEDKYCPKKPHTTKADKTAMVKKIAPREIAVEAEVDANVQMMQTRLTAMGYNPGPTDGLSGPETTKAANDFRASVGLPENSSTAKTLAALKRISGS